MIQNYLTLGFFQFQESRIEVHRRNYLCCYLATIRCSLILYATFIYWFLLRGNYTKDLENDVSFVCPNKRVKTRTATKSLNINKRYHFEIFKLKFDNHIQKNLQNWTRKTFLRTEITRERMDFNSTILMFGAALILIDSKSKWFKLVSNLLEKWISFMTLVIWI